VHDSTALRLPTVKLSTALPDTPPVTQAEQPVPAQPQDVGAGDEVGSGVPISRHLLGGKGSSTRSLTGWLVGFGSSVLADQVFFLSLTWAALQVGSPGQVGAVLAAGSIPRLLILLLGGSVADRVSPKRIIIGTDTGRAVVMAVAAALLMTEWMTTAGLIVVALAIGGLDGLFLPAVGALPAHVAPAHLMGRVAALRTVTQRAAMLGGGPLAGWLIYLYGPSAAFLGSAALFALSVGSLTLVSLTFNAASDTSADRAVDAGHPEATPAAASLTGRAPTLRPRLHPSPIAADGRTSGVFSATVVDGFRTVFRDPVLAWLLLLIAGMNLGFAGPVTAGIPLLAAAGNWGAAGAGILLGCFGLGATTAGLSLFFVRSLPHAGMMAMGAVLTMGLALTYIGTAQTLASALAGTLVLGVASGVFGTIVHAMLLSSTPKSELGRVMALLSLCIEGVVPISFAGTGLLAGAFGAHATFIVGGLIIVATTAAACTRPRLRTFQLARLDVAPVQPH
jgi:MFS family permease